MNRAATLRVSLLVALGIVPVACGGTTRNEDSGGGSGNAGAGKGGDSRAGTSGSGGDATSGSGGASGGTTTTGGAGAGGTAGGHAGSGGGGFVCKNPTLDPQSGLVVCDEGGYTHRPQAVACDNAAGQPGIGGAGGEGPIDPRELPRASGVVACTGPGDCAEFQWGYCGGDGGQIPYCRSGCITDSDCGTGSICVCGNPSSPTGGECLSAECATDADCPGSLCVTHDGVGCGPDMFRCIGARDSCASNADCAADGKQCVWNPDIEARECDFAAVCGRPFLVAEQPRLPAVEARRDWSDTLQPRVDHLSAEDRAALAEHWTELGRMEHASIAAFARFSLQLLSLGAPPELVEACTRALADETAHAKLCFGIASAYAGRAIGPGPLDVTRSLEPMSLADIVDLVILEGCVGETSAALDAADAADNAADPVIRDAYARIAADEQRHAELAFRFVQWALTQDASAVRPRLTAALCSKAFDGHAARAVAAPCLRAVLAA